MELITCLEYGQCIVVQIIFGMFSRADTISRVVAIDYVAVEELLSLVSSSNVVLLVETTEAEWLCRTTSQKSIIAGGSSGRLLKLLSCK
ncbi:hypothetical protein PFISCL1PPCAC_15863, partial [Pristionchus fissidentatus]